MVRSPVAAEAAASCVPRLPRGGMRRRRFHGGASSAALRAYRRGSLRGRRLIQRRRYAGYRAMVSRDPATVRCVVRSVDAVAAEDDYGGPAAALAPRQLGLPELRVRSAKLRDAWSERRLVPKVSRYHG